MFQPYWDKHPTQYALVQIVREGQWVTHVFEWLFMMISRFAGYAMTLAIGYLIYYAIEFKHSLDAVIAHPGFADELASLSNVIINVGPELVFPGVVVLCIRAFQRRAWVDAMLYLVTTIWFVILTMVLLNAYMSNQITADFLSTMLFWRAGAALFYTVVAAYAGGHGGLDFKSLLSELDSLREQLSSVQHEASSLQHQLDTERQQAHLERDSLRGQVNSKQHEIEELRAQMQSEQEWQASRLAGLKLELKAEQAQAATLRRDLHAARLDLDSTQQELAHVQAALESCQHEVSSSREQVSSVQSASTQQPVQVSSKQDHTVDGGQRGKVLHLDTSRSRQRGSEERALGEQIRAIIREEPLLSARAIAARLGCSPTTAAKWKSLVENEEQTANQ